MEYFYTVLIFNTASYVMSQKRIKAFIYGSAWFDTHISVVHGSIEPKVFERIYFDY